MQMKNGSVQSKPNAKKNAAAILNLQLQPLEAFVDG